MADGGDAGQVDGNAGDSGGGLVGADGAAGIGGASGSQYAKASNFVLDSSTNTGRGGGGADVGGAASIGAATGNRGSDRGAGFGGSGVSTYPSSQRNAHPSSSGGASGSTAQGSVLSLGPDFPVDLAQRQIDNGWCSYELFDSTGDMTVVFIPAGGWSQASSDRSLFPIRASRCH